MNRRHYDWKSIANIRCERKGDRFVDIACYALTVLTFALLAWCVLFDAPHVISR